MFCAFSISLSLFLLSLGSSSHASKNTTNAPRSPRSSLSLKPTSTIINDQAAYTLDPSFVITDVPTTRTYNWTIGLATGAPDGFTREMMVVNNQFPGPLIEANQGDTIVINVQNNLPTGNGIHFHGIAQKGSVWSDGVPGITQCPIPAGGSFTYNFTLTDQYGTFWWHSHMGNTMADGLLGPFIVHSPKDPYVRGLHFKEEKVVFLGDWSHKLSDDIVEEMSKSATVAAAAIIPDSLMINGVGVYNCSSAPSSSQCQSPQLPEIHVAPYSTYRLRLINHSSHAHYTFSIDEHPMKVSGADDTPVSGPTALHELPIGIGQRYDVIIDTSHGRAGDAFYVRARLCGPALPFVPEGYNMYALAVLRYVPDGSSPSTLMPDSVDWPGPKNDTECTDLSAPLAPIPFKDAPIKALDHIVLNSAVGYFQGASGDQVFRWYWNSVTYTNFIYKPLLFDVHHGRSLNASAIAHVNFERVGGADIVINNLDATIDHPYHLHGNSFFIVARGSGAITEEQYNQLQPSFFQVSNPLRRDTISIPRASYAILRIVTDNPGVWALHCHIGWHLAVGKMAAIVVQPPAIRNQSIPDTSLALCDASNLPPGDSPDTTAPGRK